MTRHWFITALLVLHVFGGVSALLAGPGAMLMKKGSPTHRLWGKTYFWAMLLIFVTALGVLFFRPNVFLTVISVFSFYSALTGYRVLFRKRAGQVEPLDWVAALVMTLAGTTFAAWGALVLTGLTTLGTHPTQDIRGLPHAFPYLAVLFGLFSLRFGIQDIRSFRKHPTDRNAWWYTHMTRMLVAYIGTVTAFTAQQVSPHIPPQWSWTMWVLPALVGVPGIYIWTHRYRVRFSGKGKTSGKAPEKASSF